MNGIPGGWRPSATLDTLRARARALAAARGFFADRGVLETETPLIVSHAVSDPQLANVRCQLSVRPGVPFFLHTSPEYHMKRLLAAGAPDIYQICKVFRDGELGPRHLPEFTMIEWYRRSASYESFIAEACELVRVVGACVGRAVSREERRNYCDLFMDVAGFDPLATGLNEIRAHARRLIPGGVSSQLDDSLGDNRTAWLDLFMISVVEPYLQQRGLAVVDRFPAEQAALAQLDAGDSRVAMRFEIYLDGVELANGYHELADADEQRRRFEADQLRRREAGFADTPADPALLAALDAGMPDACGVALGFDRLLMACLGHSAIDAVVGFATPEQS